MKMTHRSLQKSLLILAAWILLFISFSRADENSAWSRFANAAERFSKGESSLTVSKDCELVLKETDDPVLYARASFLLSESLIKDNKLSEARQVLNNIHTSKLSIPASLQEEADLRRGMIYIRESKSGQANPIFQNLYENSRFSYLRFESGLALGWNYADHEKWDACRAIVDSLQLQNPLYGGNSRMQFLKARLALADRQPDEAIKLLKDTEDPVGLSLLANAYEMADKRILAVSIFKKINDRFPGTPVAEKALMKAVEVFMRADDWLAARSELQRFLQYFPQSPNQDAVHFRLGWVYLNLKHFDDALQEFNSFSNQSYKSYFQYMQAECYRVLAQNNPENYQQAIRLFHNISSLNMNSPIGPLAKIKAALTEIEKGDTASALISLKQFLSIYPKNEMVPAVNFLVAINEDEKTAGHYFDDVIQSTVTGDISDAAFFALQNEDFRKGNYQQVINRNSYLTEKEQGSNQDFWRRANYLLMAESAYFLKHYDLARENYTKVLESGNDDLTDKAQLGLAWYTFYTRGADSAAVAFEKLKSSLNSANKSLAQYGLAVAYFYQGNYEKALRMYPVNLDYQDHGEYKEMVIRSLYQSAECYNRLQYYAQAIQDWEKLANEFPETPQAPDAMYHAADLYFRANYFPQADSLLSNLIESYPDNPFAVDAQLRYAQSAYNAGNYQEAAARYQKFVDTYPSDERSKTALEGIQYCYYQMGQTDQAAETLQKVANQSANADLAIDAKYRIATNYLNEKKYDDAVREFKDILTQYPNSSYAADAQLSLAKSFMAQEKYQDAAREFKQFVQYFPQNNQVAEAQFLLGICYFNAESYLSAVDCFDKVITDFSESEFIPACLQNSGWSYTRLGDADRAEDYFRRYLDANPQAEDRDKVQLQLAINCQSDSKTEDAKSLFTELMKTTDRAIASEAAYRLGMLLMDAKDEVKAKLVFRKAVDLGEPGDYYRLSSLAQLASIYENDGEQQKAITTYELLASSTTEEQWISAARERIQVLSAANSAAGN